jgi:hypothetical protein
MLVRFLNAAFAMMFMSRGWSLCRRLPNNRPSESAARSTMHRSAMLADAARDRLVDLDHSALLAVLGRLVRGQWHRGEGVGRPRDWAGPL